MRGPRCGQGRQAWRSRRTPVQGPSLQVQIKPSFFGAKAMSKAECFWQPGAEVSAVGWEGSCCAMRALCSALLGRCPSLVPLLPSLVATEKQGRGSRSVVAEPSAPPAWRGSRCLSVRPRRHPARLLRPSVVMGGTGRGQGLAV